jgi:hypothetical protein
VLEAIVLEAIVLGASEAMGFVTSCGTTARSTTTGDVDSACGSVAMGAAVDVAGPEPRELSTTIATPTVTAAVTTATPAMAISLSLGSVRAGAVMASTAGVVANMRCETARAPAGSEERSKSAGGGTLVRSPVAASSASRSSAAF